MKELYLLLIAQLTSIESIKWVDLNSGQLEQSDKGLKYPCVLVKLDSANKDIDEDGGQQKIWTIQLHTAFDATGSRTASDTPESVRNRSLQYVETANNIYNLFQGSAFEGFYSFECISESQEIRRDGLVVFNHVFKTVQMNFK